MSFVLLSSLAIIVSIKSSVLFRIQHRHCGCTPVVSLTSKYQSAWLPYGQFPTGSSLLHAGVRRKDYKEQVRVDLKACDVDSREMRSYDGGRSRWRQMYYDAVEYWVTGWSDIELHHVSSSRMYSVRQKNPWGIFPHIRLGILKQFYITITRSYLR